MEEQTLMFNVLSIIVNSCGVTAVVGMKHSLTSATKRVERFPSQNYFLRLHVLFCREIPRTTLSVIYHKSSILLSSVVSTRSRLFFNLNALEVRRYSSG